MSEQTTREFKLEPKKTWIPLSAAIAIGMALFAGHMWLNRELSGIHSELRMIRQNAEQIARDNWTRVDMYNWSYRLKEHNQEMYVPNPGPADKDSGG